MFQLVQNAKLRIKQTELHTENPVRVPTVTQLASALKLLYKRESCLFLIITAKS